MDTKKSLTMITDKLCTGCPIVQHWKSEEAAFQNELEWYRQRIEDLEDELFILKECDKQP